MMIYNCDYCGKRFRRRPSLVKGKNVFCSSACYGKYKSENWQKSGDEESE